MNKRFIKQYLGRKKREVDEEVSLVRVFRCPLSLLTCLGITQSWNQISFFFFLMLQEDTFCENIFDTYYEDV